MTSVDTIKGWFECAEIEGASHMIVKCDTFDFEDYPVFVRPGEDPRQIDRENEDRTMECYKISLGWEAQAKEHRAQNWD